MTKEIFNELIKRGHSEENEHNIWDISASKLLYITPELAEGYLQFKDYKPYKAKVVDAELEVLKTKVIEKLMNTNARKINIIDLGCGDGEKASEIIKLLEGKEIRYCPVDVSDELIEKATKKIKDENSETLKIKSLKTDFEDFDDVVGTLRSGEYDLNIVLLLGETVSTYDVNDLLYKLSESMFSGDVLLIGNGYRVGERFVEIEKYQDESFDKWFFGIVKSLGFEKDEVEYNARFANERLEFFYKVLKGKEVKFEDQLIEFKEGDEIIVAAQYKFFENELGKICESYFKSVDRLKNEEKEYVVLYCQK